MVMSNIEEKRFRWVLTNVSSLQDNICYSRNFVVAGCNWRLRASYKEATKGYVSLYLELADPASLPSGWRKEVKFRFTLVNKIEKQSNRVAEGQCWFDQKIYVWGFREFLLLDKLYAKDNGFLVGNRLIIVAEVQILPAIVVAEDTVKITEPLSFKDDAFDEGSYDDDDDDDASQEDLDDDGSSHDSDNGDLDNETITGGRSCQEGNQATDAYDKGSHDDTASQEDLDDDTDASQEDLEDDDVSQEDVDDDDASQEDVDDDDASQEGLDADNDGGSSQEDLDDDPSHVSDDRGQDTVKISEPLSTKKGNQATNAFDEGSHDDNASQEDLDNDDASQEDLDDDDDGGSSHGSNDGGLDTVKITETLSCKEGKQAADSFDEGSHDDDASQEDMDDSDDASSKEIQPAKETIDVNGFQVFTSQVQSVSHIFKRHPDTTLGFRPKNQQIRTAYMDALLRLIETLCQSPEKLSDDDLSNANETLVDLIDVGFKLDWLKTKLNEVSEKKRIEQSSVATLQTMEEQLQKLKNMVLNFESQLQKEKVKVLAVRAPLSFKDVVC